jgi:N-methylhydantoinase B
VLEDVIDGYVSLAQAKESYGVVIDKKEMEVDRAATQALRKKRGKADER